MREEIDARIWDAGHLRFSQDLDLLLRRAGAALARIATPSAGFARTAAVVAAVAVTFLNFEVTAA